MTIKALYFPISYRVLTGYAGSISISPLYFPTSRRKTHKDIWQFQVLIHMCDSYQLISSRHHFPLSSVLFYFSVQVTFVQHSSSILNQCRSPHPDMLVSFTPYILYGLLIAGSTGPTHIECKHCIEHLMQKNPQRVIEPALRKPEVDFFSAPQDSHPKSCPQMLHHSFRNHLWRGR